MGLFKSLSWVLRTSCASVDQATKALWAIQEVENVVCFSNTKSTTWGTDF